MALTTAEILGIINDTAKRLGFDFIATEQNLDSIIVTQPEQVNRFVDAINPIVHDKFMNNIGDRGIMKRFISKQKGGTTSRHISFGYDNDVTGDPSLISLEGLVGDYSRNPSISIFSVNHTFSPHATVDRRELAKVFTARALLEYIKTVITNLETSFEVYILNKLLTICHNNVAKMCNHASDDPNIKKMIEFRQMVTSGMMSNNFVHDSFDGWTIPTTIDRQLSPTDYLLMVDWKETDWFYNLHFHPEGIDRKVVFYPSSDITRTLFMIPYDAIVIEEFNRYVEVQEIPNCPGRYNVFFNSDITINIDFKHPLACIKEKTTT